MMVTSEKNDKYMSIPAAMAESMAYLSRQMIHPQVVTIVKAGIMVYFPSEAFDSLFLPCQILWAG